MSNSKPLFKKRVFLKPVLQQEQQFYGTIKEPPAATAKQLTTLEKLVPK